MLQPANLPYRPPSPLHLRPSQISPPQIWLRPPHQDSLLYPPLPPIVRIPPPCRPQLGQVRISSLPPEIVQIIMLVHPQKRQRRYPHHGGHIPKNAQSHQNSDIKMRCQWLWFQKKHRLHCSFSKWRPLISKNITVKWKMQYPNEELRRPDRTPQSLLFRINSSSWLATTKYRSEGKRTRQKGQQLPAFGLLRFERHLDKISNEKSKKFSYSSGVKQRGYGSSTGANENNISHRSSIQVNPWHRAFEITLIPF